MPFENARQIIAFNLTMIQLIDSPDILGDTLRAFNKYYERNENIGELMFESKTIDNLLNRLCS